jgi:hypothetical protein
MKVSAIAKSRPEPHAAASPLAHRPFADQLDPRSGKRPDHLHKRIDIAADHPVAPFHPLDGRERETGQFSQLALVDPEQRPRSPQLRGCYDG